MPRVAQQVSGRAGLYPISDPLGQFPSLPPPSSLLLPPLLAAGGLNLLGLSHKEDPTEGSADCRDLPRLGTCSEEIRPPAFREPFLLERNKQYAMKPMRVLSSVN